MQVKIVEAEDYVTLEQELNKEIEKLHKNNKTVADIKYSATESYAKAQYAMILYREA